ncbi:hydroxyacylglutathione hydrolase [cyanobiont of Ornithocercus magnificus]|nr:hydroxyacylglutathione hydrolase [cyanobiont of Ornithocercus magnificus]
MMTPTGLSTIHALPVLHDNIIWIWTRNGRAVVVDPAVADPVQNWLEQHRFRLEAVLQTHHHTDHIGGTPALLRYWPDAAVVAAAADRERIPFQTVSVRDGDGVDVLGCTLQVLDVAAHTANHLAFFIPFNEDSQIGPVLFSGDTLFSGGCGRLFEGSPTDMYRALQRLATLPANTQVYCAHDYTESNLRWAMHLQPEDKFIARRLADVQALKQCGRLSLPSTIAEESRSNLFLRAANSKELANLRYHKDTWQDQLYQSERD